MSIHSFIHSFITNSTNLYKVIRPIWYRI